MGWDHVDIGVRGQTASSGHQLSNLFAGINMDLCVCVCVHGMCVYAYVHMWNSQENDIEMENGVCSLRGTQCAERI